MSSEEFRSDYFFCCWFGLLAVSYFESEQGDMLKEIKLWTKAEKVGGRKQLNHWIPLKQN